MNDEAQAAQFPLGARTSDVQEIMMETLILSGPMLQMTRPRHQTLWTHLHHQPDEAELAP